MKLVDEFRKQVQGLGKLKRAWFTTFNLGIPFFETHVLPALLDIEKPGNRMDYENIQLQMAGIDVRVFCDMRIMDADQLKRTAVHIHGLLPSRMGGASFNEESLFHPKVIFLEDESGRMVLGTGSANFTVSGWGRNQEAFAFRPIATNEQYQQVRRFFEPLAIAAGALDAMVMGVRRKFHGTDNSWRFVHSFEPRAFLDHLLGTGDVDRLSIWSPYFARDLAGLLTQVRSAYGAQMQFSIVPDRADNKRVRTVWTPEIAGMLKSGALSFHEYPLPRAKDIELTHAKLWLASGKGWARLAIGSWNCTGRGTASFARRNVEAGFVLNVAANTEDIAGAILSLNDRHFSSLKALEEERPDLLTPPPFELQVLFDWQCSSYSVEGRFLGPGLREGYALRLPAAPKDMQLRWRARRSDQAWPLVPIEFEVRDDEALLANHSYEVWRAGELVFRGLVVETGQDHRRAQGYDTLRDLLNDLVDDMPPEGGGTVRLRKPLRHNDVPEGELPAPELDVASTPLSYFRVFQAFEQFRKHLRSVRGQDELHRLLFVYPSSLQELVAKVNDLVSTHPNPVFNWLVLQELGSLYGLAEKQWDGRRNRPEKWNSLKPAHAVGLPSRIAGNAEYMRKLKELYRDEI